MGGQRRKRQKAGRQIVANSVQFLGSRDGSGGGGNGNGFTPSSDVPADTSDYQGAPAGGAGAAPTTTFRSERGASQVIAA